MWFESLGTKMLFHVGEEMKVRRCRTRAVGRALKNFSAQSFQKIHCHKSCMQLGIVMQQEHPLVWYLRPLESNSSRKFFGSFVLLYQFRTLSGTSIIPALKVSISAILLLQFVGNWKMWHWVHLQYQDSWKSVNWFKSWSVRIQPYRQIQHGDLISLLFSLLQKRN